MRHSAAQAASPALQNVGSHYERLPQELMDIIDAFATPNLTQYKLRFRRLGTLTDFEIESIREDTRELIWIEALWVIPGRFSDFGIPPWISSDSVIFLLIRHRVTFDLILAAGIDMAALIKLRLALRHGWTGLLVHDEPLIFTEAAAREGRCDILESGIWKSVIIEHNTRLARSAAEEGQLQTVKFLRAKSIGRWPPTIMAAAASSGNYNLVVWLFEQGKCDCSTEALEAAAGGGHLGIVVFLIEQCRVACSAQVFQSACSSGNTDSLDYLAMKYPELCDSALDRLNIDAQQTSVLAWIARRRPQFDFSPILGKVITSDNLEAVSWIIDRHAELLTQDLLSHAILFNRLAVTKWLVLVKRLEIKQSMFGYRIAIYNADVVEWVVSHDSRWKSVLAGEYANETHKMHGDWFRHRYPDSRQGHNV
ncbi:hypothetical protein HK105_201994 [Polyrhizophydium stewartii]|uniref:Ankyrin repeat protein n=1 Tax=Polyrhizophydium stewartii TaxID=2732419 RepID=A0ABR4NGD7_9FUNG